jgi:hypothetical protein
LGKENPQIALCFSDDGGGAAVIHFHLSEPGN